ncbi:cell wall-active antibiotics response protein LiaF [Metabacillus sediminilitoris]|jgi:lia operon protein LiaF|uniref:Cell wall-active antibiotics response protein n=1 Tax=Metabacillus sediminilitoris TaxID=2567941 RepID=A0A4S4BTV8_9BACI|nr:cell wall-active antibiotics response protein LiaF [Metabacillus sediminilitoris]QGQ48419.1 cell wall-active antibiotics response protein [Metabacillus sediminilitoris]THF76316.1 cell wall-active antibiotics response protein [Metabacillus sediminilitoris]
MIRNIKSDYVNWIIIAGFILLLLEVLFFNGGLIVTFLLSIGCIYLGKKWKPRVMGKAFFWIGWIWLIITVLNMMTFRYFLCVVLLYIIVQFFQSQKHPKQIKPIILEAKTETGSDPFIKREKIFENKFFTSQMTPEHVYEWNDVNIQVGIGNTVIDLSDTVLPKGEAIISIRSLIGNVQVLVPYEVEVHVNHSVMAGTVAIFQDQEQRIVNETIVYETAEYVQAEQKVKLITSVIAGNLEVKRV